MEYLGKRERVINNPTPENLKSFLNYYHSLEQKIKRKSMINHIEEKINDLYMTLNNSFKGIQTKWLEEICSGLNSVEKKASSLRYPKGFGKSTRMFSRRYLSQKFRSLQNMLYENEHHRGKIEILSYSFER